MSNLHCSSLLKACTVLMLSNMSPLLFAAEDATPCISVIDVNGARSFKNNCGFAIEIAWCYVGKDCRHGDWGYTNTWTFGPGFVRSASTFSSDVQSSTLKFGACKGANTRLEELDARQHNCYD